MLSQSLTLRKRPKTLKGRERRRVSLTVTLSEKKSWTRKGWAKG